MYGATLLWQGSVRQFGESLSINHEVVLTWISEVQSNGRCSVNNMVRSRLAGKHGRIHSLTSAFFLHCCDKARTRFASMMPFRTRVIRKDAISIARTEQKDEEGVPKALELRQGEHAKRLWVLTTKHISNYGARAQASYQRLEAETRLLANNTALFQLLDMSTGDVLPLLCQKKGSSTICNNTCL